MKAESEDSLLDGKERIEDDDGDGEEMLWEEGGRGSERDDFTWLRFKGSCLHGWKNENHENKLKISSET